MYLKSLANLKNLNFSEKVFNNNYDLYKILLFLNKRLHFFENVFKKPQNLSMKKTSIYLKIILKKPGIF
jgi:hypothetical protein